jgi:hypothetical protein
VPLRVHPQYRAINYPLFNCRPAALRWRGGGVKPNCQQRRQRGPSFSQHTTNNKRRQRANAHARPPGAPGRGGGRGRRARPIVAQEAAREHAQALPAAPGGGSEGRLSTEAAAAPHRIAAPRQFFPLRRRPGADDRGRGRAQAARRRPPHQRPIGLLPPPRAAPQLAAPGPPLVLVKRTHYPISLSLSPPPEPMQTFLLFSAPSSSSLTC